MLVVNKKIVMGASVGVLCAVGIVGAVLSGRDKGADVEVFKDAGKQGEELLSSINATVDLTDNIEIKDTYTPLEVKRAFIDGGGCARVIVYNNTDTPITAYDLEIMHFDDKGQPIGENGSYTVSGILLNGREDFGIDKYVGGKEGGAYIKAVVKRVLYNDGTAWENDNAEAEIALQGTAFDIDEFNAEYEKNAENVQKAAQTPYVYINSMTAVNEDAIAGRRDLKLVLTNTSQKTIRDIKVAVAEFDRNSQPVDVSPQIYVGKNIRLASCKGMQLNVGESRAFASSGFLENECYRINAIVTEITFADGSVWRNPYATDWLLWFV